MSNSPRLALLPCFAAAILLFGCDQAASPPSEQLAPPQGGPIGQVLTPMPFTEGERLPDGDYGIDRAGDTPAATFALERMACRAPDALQLDTSDGTYVVHMLSFPRWTCPQAMDQLRQTAGREPAGMRVGFVNRGMEGPETGQVNILLDNRASLLLMAEGLFKVD